MSIPSTAERARAYQELLAARAAADPDTRAIVVEFRAHTQAPAVIVTTHSANPDELALTLASALRDVLIAACEARRDRAGLAGLQHAPTNGSN